MCKLRPQHCTTCLLRYWVLSLTLNSLLFLQILKPLFGKSQLKQEILEQDYKGVVCESSLNSNFFLSPFCGKLLVPKPFIWFVKKKGGGGFSKFQEERGNLIQRRKCWPIMEFLFSIILPSIADSNMGHFCSSTSSYVKARFSSLSTSSTSLCFLGREYMMSWSYPNIILMWMPQLSVSWGEREFIRSGKHIYVDVRLLLVQISASPLRRCLPLWASFFRFLKCG